MKKKFFLCYAVLNLIIFTTFAVYSSFRIYSQFKYNNEAGERLILKIKDSLTASYLTDERSDSQGFKEKMKSFFIYDNKLLSLAVRSEREGLLYMYASDPKIFKYLPSGNDQRTTLEYNKDRSYKIFKSSIDICTPYPIYLETAYKIIEKNNIFIFAKAMVIYLLAFIIFTSIILIISPEKSSPQKQKAGSEKEGPLPENFPGHKSEKENIPAENAEKYIPESEKKEEQKSSSISESQSEKKNASPCLFSVSTGFVLNRYFSERLTFELKEAASSDQDIVLALFNFRSSLSENIFSEILFAAKKVSFMRELLFENGKNRFNIIIPNKNLNEGIDAVKKFISEVETISGIGTLEAGLSSRNGRLIEAERFISEAEAALRKSSAEHTSLTAFDPDPDRYREFINKNY